MKAKEQKSRMTELKRDVEEKVVAMPTPIALIACW